MPEVLDWKQRLANWARSLKLELMAVARAARDPRTPWYARALALVLLAYVASPVDLIPDFIPVLGMIDDLIIVPLGLALVLHLIPSDVLAEHRARSAADAHLPPSNAGLAMVVGLWLLGLLAVAALMHGWFGG